MQRLRIHLISALIAFGLLGGLVAAFNAYAQSVEARYLDVLTPRVIVQATQGEALPVLAFQRPDLLPLYGSSEMFNDADSYGAIDFFEKYPTGFTVFEVAKAGIQSLILAQDMATIGDALRGKRVVISFTPDMFHYHQATQAHYAGSFSTLHAYELAFSPNLSFKVKQLAARRMLDYPATLSGDPLLQTALVALSKNNLAGRAFYFVLLPLGKLRIFILREQDHFEVLVYLHKHAWLKPFVKRQPAAIDWADAVQKERADQLFYTTNNPYGVENMDWHVTEQEKLSTPIPPGSQDADFIQSLNDSREWSDLEILLEVLKEMGARPLFLGRPMNRALWEALGVSAQAQDVYYQRMQKTIAAYPAALVDFQEYGGDKYFSFDEYSHTSRVGWIYVDRVLDSFYHQPSQQFSSSSLDP